MITRRLLCQSALAIATSLATVPAFADNDPLDLNVRLSFIANVQFGDFYVAIDKGYFADEGMNVNLIPGGPGARDALVELASGNVDIAISAWPPFVEALNQGNDFVLIGVQFQSSPLGIISLPDYPIESTEDLVGQRILAQRGVASLMVETAMAAADLDPSTVTLLPAGFSADPLLAGDGVGYTGFGTNQAVALEVSGMEPGKDFFFRSFDELGLSNVTGLISVQREFLEENRDYLVEFMASLIRAHDVGSKDLGLAAKLAAEVYGIDYGLEYEHQLVQNGAQQRFIAPPSTIPYSINVEKITGPVIEMTRLSGQDSIPDNLLDYIDASIVEDAVKIAR